MPGLRVKNKKLSTKCLRWDSLPCGTAKSSRRCDQQSHLVPNWALGMGPCHQSTGANKSFSVLRLHNRRSAGGARPGRGSAWPPPDSYFFLLLPIRTFSSWVTLKPFVGVQGKNKTQRFSWGTVCWWDRTNHWMQSGTVLPAQLS